MGYKFRDCVSFLELDSGEVKGVELWIRRIRCFGLGGGYKLGSIVLNFKLVY